MEEKTYNGWTNYETWAVNLWMNNEYGSYKHWREEARRHYEDAGDSRAVWDESLMRDQVARSTLADQLKEYFKGESPLKESVNLYSDLLGAALGEVDWHELADALLDDIGHPKELSMEITDGYSRAQAIEDGVLIDSGEMAKEAGFTMPVALTSAVWAEYVQVPEKAEGQDEQGRLWDVLTMLRFAIKQGGRDSQLLFTVRVNKDGEPKPVELKSTCGPGDDGEPVVTIMLPHED